MSKLLLLIPESFITVVGFPGAQSKIPQADITSCLPNQGQQRRVHVRRKRVEYVAQKSGGRGIVNVYLDGQLQKEVSLDLSDFPVLFGVVVFSATGLQSGRHVIRIESAGDARVNLESIRVFSA